MDTLVLAVAFVFIFLRLEKIGQRVLAVKEKGLALQEKAQELAHAPPPKADPIPPGLWLQANSYEEKWAREDALQTLYQLYEEHGCDWNRVAQLYQTKAG